MPPRQTPISPARRTRTARAARAARATLHPTPPPTGSSTSGDTGEPTTTGPPCSDPARCPATCDTISQGCPEGQKGACLAFCTGDPEAPHCDDPATVCARVDHLWPINVCVPPCDPLAYDCPDAELGVSAMVCAPATGGFGCVLRGNLDGQPLGQPCLDHRDCIAAAHCAPPNTVPGCQGLGCCAAYCDLDAPSCPLSGQDCVPHFAPGTAPAGLEDVGLCAAPG